MPPLFTLSTKQSTNILHLKLVWLTRHEDHSEHKEDSLWTNPKFIIIHFISNLHTSIYNKWCYCRWNFHSKYRLTFLCWEKKKNRDYRNDFKVNVMFFTMHLTYLNNQYSAFGHRYIVLKVLWGTWVKIRFSPGNGTHNITTTDF